MGKLVQACFAEFVGTFGLCFFGIGAIVVGAPGMPGTTLLQVALAHGAALMVCVPAALYLSGSQFNPAVSIALVVIGKQPVVRGAAFVVVQLLAAACAAGVFQFVLGPEVANHDTVKLGATAGLMTSAGDAAGVLILEAIATFFLMLVILASIVDDRAPKLGGLTVGLTVVACILAIGPLTGASMNPARTFGPALCGGRWEMHWAYWVGPVAGACIAAAGYRVLWAKREQA